MVLKNGRYGRFWACPSYPGCRGRHGAHQATGLPLGTPTNKTGIKARRLAHAAFDPLWQSGGMSRRDAYRWLTLAMGAAQQIHIASLSIEDCERVVKLCLRYKFDPKPQEQNE